MIKIRIADVEKELASADEQWINQQINRRREDGHTVCVIITIEEGDFNMALSTPTCGARGGGSRPLHPKEQEVLELWHQRGLNDAKFTGGNVVAFLNQLKRLF